MRVEVGVRVEGEGGGEGYEGGCKSGACACACACVCEEGQGPYLVVCKLATGGAAGGAIERAAVPRGMKKGRQQG